MEQLYEHIQRKRLNSTSDEDLLRLQNVNLLKYSDLKRYNTLDEIFKNGACILFIPNKGKPVGHWVVIFRWNNYVEFFCSYGRPYSFYENRLKDHQIARLVNNSNYQVYSNPYRFQSSESSACGRHVLTRLLYRNLHINNYKDFVTLRGIGDFTDDFVTLLTDRI